jgi:succinylglutamate desuccinylase
VRLTLLHLNYWRPIDTLGAGVPCSYPHSSKATPDDPYEVRRARELNQLVGPKSSDQAFDFLLDLHNTTANMGACLILESSYSIFTLHLCHYLKVAGVP